MTNEEMLTQIDGKVDELLQWKATLDERCSGHRNLTDEVRQTIYGNPGKSDGLQFDVSRLTNGRKFWSYIYRGGILAALISFGAFLLTYLKGKL
jgi:hypothetical protein